MGSLFANKKLRLHISRGVCLTEHIQPLRYLAALVAHLVPVYHQLGGLCFFLVGGGGAPSTDATKSGPMVDGSEILQQLVSLVNLP